MFDDFGTGCGEEGWEDWVGGTGIDGYVAIQVGYSGMVWEAGIRDGCGGDAWTLGSSGVGMCLGWMGCFCWALWMERKRGKEQTCTRMSGSRVWLGHWFVWSRGETIVEGGEALSECLST